MQAKFTQGSIFKHICIMTLSSTAGLMSLFLVDLVDMYWLSLLGEVELAAGVGFAGSVLFFTLSLTIGLAIACSAVVSQAIGKGNQVQTRRLIGSIFVFIIVLIVPVTIAMSILSNDLLIVLGATGRAHELAYSYMTIVLVSLPIMSLAMAASGVFRAMGRAKEAMYITLIGGFVNAILDPICIFGLGMGIEGAAIATVCSRVAMLVYGVRLIYWRYQLFSWPKMHHAFKNIRVFLHTAVPSVFTNLATPIGFAFITAIVAQFGDDAVAGNTIVSKIQPLAFAGIFALSGAVGPIAGQNFGAKQYVRVKSVLMTSILFVSLYCLVACSLLWLFTDIIISVFQAKGESPQLIRWFCLGLSTVFVFNGITFVTNALFNNLNLAHWATCFNFLKTTVFTMPFAYVGGQLGELFGVMVGVLIGAGCVSILGFTAAYYKISRLVSRVP